MSSLEELAALALALPASQPAIEFQGHWFTWGDMRQVADRLAALIEACGAERPAAIAFVPRNRPSAVAALLGLIAKGHTIRMLYAFQSATALTRDVQHLAPAVLIAAAGDYSAELLSVVREQGIAAIALEEMDAVAAALPAPSQNTAPASRPARPHIEILTSGTTGPPKRFAMGYDLIAEHIVRASAARSAPKQNSLPPPPPLLFFPLGNISGIYSTLPAMLNAHGAVLLERLSVAEWHAYVLRYRPEVSGLPPAGVRMVLDADIPVADLASIRTLGTGAAPLDPTAHRAFEERYGIPILLSYGATEFGGPVTAMTADLHATWGKEKFGSVGRALPGAQLRVIDPDTGVVTPGHEGLLEVIAPCIGAQWIRTSDIACIDEEGFLFLRGRADGAITRGGFKLLPETIERALLLHEAILAAAVVGLPDERLGQVPAAAVQFKPRVKPPSAPDLEAHLRAHVYATHIPVRWRFVEELPRTPSLKVDRPALLRLFAEAP